MILLTAPSSFALGGAALFRYADKVYDIDDLPPAKQKALIDLEIEHHARVSSAVDGIMLDLYLDSEAKKKKTTRAKLEAEWLSPAEPTDEQIKAWYEANKARLPGTMQYDAVRVQIKEHLKTEATKTAREALIVKARAAGKGELLLPMPSLPIVKVDIAGLPIRGEAKAKVTIVEFADYQCPHCREAAPFLDKLLERYDGKVNMVFVDYPINPSGISTVVANGAFCAGLQDKFWEYHDLAYTKQDDLSTKWPTAAAVELKLNAKAFATCMATTAPAKRVARSKAEGDRVGISGTPTIFIGGKRVQGYDEPKLVEAIEAALK